MDQDKGRAYFTTLSDPESASLTSFLIHVLQQDAMPVSCTPLFRPEHRKHLTRDGCHAYTRQPSAPGSAGSSGLASSSCRDIVALNSPRFVPGVRRLYQRPRPAAASSPPHPPARIHTHTHLSQHPVSIQPHLPLPSASAIPHPSRPFAPVPQDGEPEERTAPEGRRRPPPRRAGQGRVSPSQGAAGADVPPEHATATEASAGEGREVLDEAEGGQACRGEAGRQAAGEGGACACRCQAGEADPAQAEEVKHVRRTVYSAGGIVHNEGNRAANHAYCPTMTWSLIYCT